jgi:hypothetical protein
MEYITGRLAVSTWLAATNRAWGWLSDPRLGFPDGNEKALSLAAGGLDISRRSA